MHSDHPDHQVPIWFFIGLLLLAYGLIITASGAYQYCYPPPEEARVALFQYHADLWWGLLLTVIGATYTARFRPGRT